LENVPESLASRRALYALGLGLLAFVTSASPIGILAIAVPAGVAAIAVGAAEAGRAPRRSRSRRLAGAGIAFTLLGFGLATAWIYASFAFASAFGGSPRIDPDRLLCTACQVLANRSEPEREFTPRRAPIRTPADRAQGGATVCELGNVTPVWPESDVSGICAGSELLTVDGPWRRQPANTARQFAVTVLGWPSASVDRAFPESGQAVVVEIDQSATQRTRITVQELVPATWSVVEVAPVPSPGGLVLRASGTNVSVEARPAPGASSAEIKTIGYRDAQASASSSEGRISLGVPSTAGGGRAAGWLLIVSKDERGRVLTAEAVHVPPGAGDFRIG
jgi:hypothetical protein